MRRSGLESWQIVSVTVMLKFQDLGTGDIVYTERQPLNLGTNQTVPNESTVCNLVAFMDGLSQVTGNLACYARLASLRKKICLRAWWGHADATPEWYDTSAKWRKQLFEGQRP